MLELFEFHWKNKWFRTGFLDFCISQFSCHKIPAIAGMGFCDDLRSACLATWHRSNDSKLAFSSFLSFSLGTCRQNEKKSHSRCRGVEKVRIRIPMLHGNQKKNDSHAAWECQKWFLRHLSSENASLKNYKFFVVVDFGWFGVVKKLFGCGNQ